MRIYKICLMFFCLLSSSHACDGENDVFYISTEISQCYKILCPEQGCVLNSPVQFELLERLSRIPSECRLQIVEKAQRIGGDFEFLNNFLKYLEIHTADKFGSEEFLTTVDTFIVNFLRCPEFQAKTGLLLEESLVVAHLFSEHRQVVNFSQLVDYIVKNILDDTSQARNFKHLCHEITKTGGALSYLHSVRTEDLDKIEFNDFMSYVSNLYDGGYPCQASLQLHSYQDPYVSNLPYACKGELLYKNPGIWPKQDS